MAKLDQPRLANATARAIIQTIQFANSTGTHKVTANVFTVKDS